jgi:hypothetical protein
MNTFKQLNKRDYTSEDIKYLNQLTNSTYALKEFSEFYKKKNKKIYNIGIFELTRDYDTYRKHITKFTTKIKHLKIEFSYYAIVERCQDGFVHAHGYIASKHNVSTLANQLRPIWGSLAGTGSNLHIEKIFNDKGWIRYCARIKKLTKERRKPYLAKGRNLPYGKIKSLPIKYNLDRSFTQYIKQNKPTQKGGFKKVLLSLIDKCPDNLAYYKDVAA